MTNEQQRRDARLAALAQRRQSTADADTARASGDDASLRAATKTLAQAEVTLSQNGYYYGSTGRR